jgi:hypothetical protein
MSHNGSYWEDLPHQKHLSPGTPDLGNVIVMTLDQPCQYDTLEIIRFNYYTDQDSKALNWIKSQQTGNDMMFTSCAPTNCRYFAPIMDSQFVSFTYDAIMSESTGSNSISMSADQT